MRKYIRLFSILYSLVTFMVGWNDYQEIGYLRLFNVGLMSFTALTGFILGYDWAKEMDRKDEEK